jgi:hypothetical protein
LLQVFKMIPRRDSCPGRLKDEEQQQLLELPPPSCQPSAHKQPNPVSQSAPVSPKSHSHTMQNVQHLMSERLRFEQEQALALCLYPYLADRPPGWQPHESSSTAPLSPGSHLKMLLSLQGLLFDESSDDSSNGEESSDGSSDSLPVTPMADGSKAIFYDTAGQQTFEVLVSVAII